MRTKPPLTEEEQARGKFEASACLLLASIFVAALIGIGDVFDLKNPSVRLLASGAAVLLYPLVGFLGMSVCLLLLLWGIGEDSTDDLLAYDATQVWLAALWPIALVACLVVCPTLGLIRMMFWGGKFS